MLLCHKQNSCFCWHFLQFVGLVYLLRCHGRFWQNSQIIALVRLWSFKDCYCVHGSYKWTTYYFWKMWVARSQCFSPHMNNRHLWLLKKSTLGAILELPAKQQCQSSPFTSKMGEMGWIGCAVVGNSKRVPRILIFLIAMDFRWNPLLPKRPEKLT